jgi:hypothetical protein
MRCCHRETVTALETGCTKSLQFQRSPKEPRWIKGRMIHFAVDAGTDRDEYPGNVGRILTYVISPAREGRVGAKEDQWVSPPGGSPAICVLTLGLSPPKSPAVLEPPFAHLPAVTSLALVRELNPHSQRSLSSSRTISPILGRPSCRGSIPPMLRIRPHMVE